jgi:sterol desaturase/sphingolipid hydroxylase (fatty acid hydroxylase superfamily)
MQTQQTNTFFVKFMRMGYFADFYVYPMAALVSLLLSIFLWPTNWLAIIALFIGGFCLWGLMEYFMHRFAFHHAPVFKQGHGEHHKHPKWHIGTPFFITLPGYILIAWALALVFGYGIISALLSGFIMGYFGYLIVHHFVHSKRIVPGSFWYRFKKFHDIHHFEQEVNFGVSWQMWDKVFGTYQKSH